MARSHAAALTALLALGVTSLAGAQTVGDRTLTSESSQSQAAVAADSSALADSVRALVAQDDSQPQADQARLDSLQLVLGKDQRSTSRAVAASPALAAARTTRQQQANLDLKRNKLAQAQLAASERSTERNIKQAQKELAKAQKELTKAQAAAHRNAAR